MQDPRTEPEKPRSEFAQSVGRGLLIGAVALVLILPPYLHYRHRNETAPAAKPAATAKAPEAAKPRHVIRHADFGAESPSPEVRRMANWVADSHDNQTHAFVVIDKPNAKVYLFDNVAHLQTAVPTVIGSAIGDDTYPGVGDKPLSALKPYERTTPAGRFVAEVGETSSRHEDVVWVDYDNAVSMHRIIKVPERLKAIATPTPADNRLSNGCINLPPEFYEKALRPAVDHYGVIVYILPETRPIQQTFASFYDVDAASKLAQN